MRCRHCNRVRTVTTCQHFGGGNWRRPGRWYSSSICEECIDTLLPYEQEGHHQISNWSLSGLKRAKAVLVRWRELDAQGLV